MGKYNGAVITDAGHNLIAQAISGSELEWTVMRTSSTAIPAGTNLATLTSLTGIEQESAITGASVYDSNVIQISARFSNTGIATVYYIQTVGIYGKITGGAETLIAVMTAVTPDEMPVYDSDSPSAFIFNTQIAVQNANSVTMTVSDTGTATVADLRQKVSVNGGDLSETVINTATTASGQYPVPAAGDSMRVILGKIRKFFAEIVKVFYGATGYMGGTKGLVPAPEYDDNTAYLCGDGTWTQPVNSIYAEDPGVLDARVGNNLRIRTEGVQITTEYTELIDVILTYMTGAKPLSIYKSGSSAYTDLPQSEASTSEFRAIGYGYGVTLNVLLSINGHLYVRQSTASAWVDSWQRIYTSGDISLIIQDNLTTNSADYALSARQGKLLNDRMDTAATPIMVGVPAQTAVSSSTMTTLMNTPQLAAGTYLVMVSIMLGGATEGGQIKQLTLRIGTNGTVLMNCYPFAKAHTFVMPVTVTANTQLYLQGTAVANTTVYTDTCNYIRLLKLK